MVSTNSSTKSGVGVLVFSNTQEPRWNRMLDSVINELVFFQV